MLPQHPVYTTKLISLNQTEHKGIFPKNQPQTTHGSHLKFTKKKHTILEVAKMAVLQRSRY